MHGVLVMSRIGKHPVSVPKGVQMALVGQTLTVSGKLGQLEHTLPGDVQVAENDGTIVVQPRGDSKRARAMWGLSRTLVANMVEGVSTGFTRKLLISGVGFRAAIDGKVLNLQLGYSHDIKYAVPTTSTSNARPRRRSPSPAPIVSASARSPRNCARSACRSPTRARASAMTTR